MPSSACVLLASGFEEVEAITPIDYLRRAGIRVTIAGLGSKIIEGAHGIRIETDTDISALGDTVFDAIILPGGMGGAKNLAQSNTVRKLIKQYVERDGIIAAICAAPALVLGEACGMLENRKYTCYPGLETHVKQGTFTGADVQRDGSLISAAGPALAGAFSIAIIEALIGPEKAAEVAAGALLSR